MSLLLLLGATQKYLVMRHGALQASAMGVVDLDDNFPAASILAVCATYLLGASSDLARLVLNLANDFLRGTFNLVL